MGKPCVICQDTSHDVALPGRATEDRQGRRLPATDRRPVSRVELGQTRLPWSRGYCVCFCLTLPSQDEPILRRYEEVLDARGGLVLGVRDETAAKLLGLGHGTMKRLMAQWVLHGCKEVEEKTSITTRAWRHLSWTFEEAPMLAERAAREHLHGTLFEEETELAEDEPAEETDFILHDDDDAAEDEAHEVHDEEDVVPESTGTAVAEAVLRSPLWLPKSHAQNAFCFCASRTAGIHQNHELFSGRCRAEGAPASCR